MRKSRYVTMLLAGAAVTALSACDQNQQPDAMLYGDAASCSQDFDAGACTTAYETAKAEHVAQAPKFATAAECEAAGFSPCEAAPTTTANSGSSGMFMPLMMGYMMGRMMSPGAMGPGAVGPAPGTTATAGKSAWSGTTRPVYANRDGYLFAGNNNVGRVAPGTTSLGSAGVPMRTAARGGFGGTANRMSGGS